MWTILNCICVWSSLSNTTSLSKCADSVATWFLQNGLKLNPSKTESIIVDIAQRLKNIPTPKSSVECLGVPIASADSVHILGVTLSNALTLDKHISNTVSSCNYHIRALKHIRLSLTHDAAVAIACSLVYYTIATHFYIQHHKKLLFINSVFKTTLNVLCLN